MCIFFKNRATFFAQQVKKFFKTGIFLPDWHIKIIYYFCSQN